MFSCSKKLSKVLCSFDTHFLFKYDLFVEYILGGTEPLSHRFAMPAPLIGEPLAGRASPAVRVGPIGRKAPGPVLIGSGICIAAVNLGSGARSFPNAKNFARPARPLPTRQWLPLWGSWQRCKALPERGDKRKRKAVSHGTFWIW